MAISTTKGTDIMLGLLLDQYQDKENLLEYFSVFFEEMDLLYKEVEEVYLGRMIEHAIGAQLDVIGIILDQSRSVAIPTFFFGFQGADNVLKMADEATPADGGVFRDETQGAASILPLNDTTYRRLLLAKAFANTSPTRSFDDGYNMVSLLLGRVPRLMNLVVTAPRQITLNLSAIDTNLADLGLIEYFSKYMVPLGTSFNAVRI